MSYRHDMPVFIKRVPRDDKAQSAITDAMAQFGAEMEAAWAVLIERNDGKPPIKRKTVSEVLAEVCAESQANFDTPP